MIYKIKPAWLAVIGGIIAAFMSIVDIQITNAAIGKIQSGINSPLSDGSWISSAYLIAEIIAIPITNFWLNYLGQRKTALLFCILFIAGSFLCSQAWNLNSLIVYRCIQGFSAGVLMAVAYVIIITNLTEDHEKQFAIILFGAVVAIAPTVGPLCGGIITTFLNWQYLFYINIPFGIISIILLAMGLAKKNFTPNRYKVDIVGIVTISIGLGCLQYVLEDGYKYQWFSSNFITTIFTIAVISIIAFIINVLSIKNPLIDLNLFKNIRFTLACCGAGIAGAAMFSFFFIVPYFLITLYNYSPIQISYILMWIGLTQLFMIFFAKFILRKINIYLIIAIGFSLFAASVLIWSTFSIHINQPLIILSVILRGISSMWFLTPLGVLATTSVDKSQSSSASCLYNITRSLGGAFGVAIITTYIGARHQWYLINIPQGPSIFNHEALSYQFAFADSFRILFILLILASLFFVIVWALSHKILKYKLTGSN